METQELLGIIANGEDSKHQFKATINNVNSLASEMAAFSNSRGGHILIGVNDDGSPRYEKNETTIPAHEGLKVSNPCPKWTTLD